MAQAVTDQNFSEEVLKADGKILVDFWAPWCGPCQMLSPVIEEVGQEMKDKVKVVKMNVDENPQTSQQYGITAIPTAILFEKGEIKERIVGFRMKQDYIDAVNK